MKKPTPIPKDELVAALQARSQKAYSILYDNYAPTLLGIICKVVKNSNDSENLLQDTFVTIWKNIDSYDAEKDRLFPWLSNIARNTAIHFLRSQRAIGHTDTQMLTEGIGIERNRIAEAINVGHIDVPDTVARIDPALRLIIDLIYFEGYTPQEVADNLKMPLDTVKTRSQMALQHLKNLLIDAI